MLVEMDPYGAVICHLKIIVALIIKAKNKKLTLNINYEHGHNLLAIFRN